MEANVKIKYQRIEFLSHPRSQCSFWLSDREVDGNSMISTFAECGKQSKPKHTHKNGFDTGDSRRPWTIFSLELIRRQNAALRHDWKKAHGIHIHPWLSWSTLYTKDNAKNDTEPTHHPTWFQNSSQIVLCNHMTLMKLEEFILLPSAPCFASLILEFGRCTT
jgi:hypothetical protein